MSQENMYHSPTYYAVGRSTDIAKMRIIMEDGVNMEEELNKLTGDANLNG